MSKIRKIAAALPLVCAALLFGFGQAKADTYIPEGSTTGTGPYLLTSSCTGGPCAPDYSNLTTSDVDLQISTPFKFNQLSSLSATFTDILGGATVGSPRISVALFDGTNTNYLHIALGNSPNYNDNEATLNTYRNFNVIGNNDAGRYDDSQFGGSPFTDYSSTAALVGNFLVTDIFFVLDGGYSRDQALSLNSINYSLAAAETPLPAALPLFASGLGALGFVGWRKRRKRTA